MIAAAVSLAAWLANPLGADQSIWKCVEELSTRFGLPVILEWTGQPTATLPPRRQDESDREYLNRVAASWDYVLVVSEELAEGDVPATIALSPKWVPRQLVQYDLLRKWSSAQTSASTAEVAVNGQRGSIRLRDQESLRVAQLIESGWLSVKGADPCFPDTRFIIHADNAHVKAVALELMRCLGATVSVRAGDPWLVVDPKPFRQKRIRLALEYAKRASDMSTIDVLSARCEAEALLQIGDEELSALFSSWETTILVNADPRSELEEILNARWDVLVKTLRGQGEAPPELAPASRLQAWLTGKGSCAARAEGKDGRAVVF